MALFASAMATFGANGIVVALLVCWFWLLIGGMPVRAAGRTWSTLVVITALLMLYAVFMPSIRSPRRLSHMGICMFRNREVLLAILKYQERTGHFPPPYLADEDGNPMHSWRVLVLPDAGQQELYAQYRFDEPWDGPNNSKLLARIPPIYQCPSHPDRDLGLCYVAAITGPDTAWRVAPPMRLSDLETGSLPTLLFCETLKGIPWTKPTDLTPEEFVDQARLHGQSFEPFGHRNETLFTIVSRSVHVGYADGHLSRITLPHDSANVKWLSSRFRSDDPSHGALSSLMIEPKVNWPSAISSLLFLVIGLMPATGYFRRTSCSHAMAA